MAGRISEGVFVVIPIMHYYNTGHLICCHAVIGSLQYAGNAGYDRKEEVSMGKGSRWWCVLMGVFVIVVSGCSGGGGGGGDQADGEGDNLVTASSLSEFEGECTLVAIAGDPRVVNAEYDGQGRVSTSITLDGSSSYDPEGTKVTRYRWCLVGFEAPGSPVGSQTILNMGRFGSPVCTYTATETGRYTFELTVSNGKGRIGKDTLVVTTVPTLIE